jgi:capsular polysaccharide transport system ATP-binding protein
MTVELRNVAVRTRGTVTPVSLNNINIRIDRGDHVALFAPPHGGLELVIDVICGADAPESGRVLRNRTMSWPLPGASFLHKHQSFVGNARFIARLYEMDQHSFIPKVIEMAGVQEIADERIGYCPRAAVSRFGFAVGACLPFDIYLFTSTNIGDRDDREKYSEIILNLGKNSGLLIATSAAKTALPYCNKAYVLDQEGSVYYDDVEAATAHLERISKKVDDLVDESLAPEDDRVFDDFWAV